MEHDKDTRDSYAIEAAEPVAAGLKGRQLQGLIELSRLMNATADLDELLAAIMDKTAEAVGAEGASVILLDPVDADEPDLVFHVTAGSRAGELSSFRLRWGEGYAGQAAKEHRTVIANDLARDNRHAKRVDEAIDFDTRSLVAVPLTLPERLAGVLEVVNKRDGEFTADDAGFCEAIASHVAVAIERARLAAENLRQQRLAAIGETIAGTAHCIKNIVNALRGGAYILKGALGRGDVGKAQSGWNILEGGVNRISTLSLDMLTCSKDHTPLLVRTDLGTVAREVCDLVRESARGQGVAVTCRRDEPVEACAEAAGIQRCLMNLVTNAVDACAEAAGTAVVVSCGPAGEDEVEIRVEDDGVGMSDQTQAKLFQPFFSTKGSKGTGLGLCVTRKIIEEHGGRLAISSVPNAGTTVTIRLPAGSEEA